MVRLAYTMAGIAKLCQKINMSCLGSKRLIYHLSILMTRCQKLTYRISSHSFCENYSFLNLDIQRSQYIRPKVTVHKGAETIQGRKLFKGGNYMRKYGIS